MMGLFRVGADHDGTGRPAMVQWAAASKAGAPKLIYYTYGDHNTVKVSHLPLAALPAIITHSLFVVVFLQCYILVLFIYFHCPVKTT